MEVLADDQYGDHGNFHKDSSLFINRRCALKYVKMLMSRQLLVCLGLLIIHHAIGCQPNRATLERSTLFVPADFVVPRKLQHDRFYLRPLQASDAEQDFAAVMSSADQLRKRFDQTWPADDFTIEQNREHLQLHEQQFARRESFVYAVLSPDDAVELGCVYIIPDESQHQDAVAISWLRTDYLNGDLPLILRSELELWMANEWPFRNVAFDGPLDFEDRQQ